MREPDYAALRAIYQEVQRLKKDRKWNREAYLKLLPRAKEASMGDGDALATLLREAKPDWIDRSSPEVAAAG